MKWNRSSSFYHIIPENKDDMKRLIERATTVSVWFKGYSKGTIGYVTATTTELCRGLCDHIMTNDQTLLFYTQTFCLSLNGKGERNLHVGG